MRGTEKFEEVEYWKKVGWVAHSRGLPSTTTDVELLASEQQQRATAQGLTQKATWFDIFCAELGNGLKPEAPDYCDCGDCDWEERPAVALKFAQRAAGIIMRKTTK